MTDIVVPKARENRIRIYRTREDMNNFYRNKMRVDSAKAALNELLAGNSRHVHKYARDRSNRDERLAKELSRGQKPIATVLACADSRVNPARVFNQKDGKIFKVENAGNIAYDEATLGTLEYGVKHAHTPLMVIMGHEFCGAVTATCQCEGKKQEDEGSINFIIENIAPTAKRADYDVESAILFNIFDTIETITKRSEIIVSHIKERKLDIVAGYYSISSGWFLVLDKD